jgi:hypothetical protein
MRDRQLFRLTTIATTIITVPTTTKEPTMTAYPVIAEYPAYKLINKIGYTFRDGDEIAIPYETKSHGTLYNFFKMGSVAGYAVHNGDDVETSLQRARDNGHDLFYAYGLGTCLTAHKVDQKTVALLNYGDVIKAFGRFFRLDKAPNNNVELVEVEMTDADYMGAVIAAWAAVKASS